MPQKKRMSLNARREYLRALQEEYELAPRSKKSQLLNEMERATGLHRHSLLRLLHSSLERQPRQRQRGRRYGAQEEAVIHLLAEAMDYACAERLTPNLLSMAEQLAAHGELELTKTLREKLSRISVSTVRRLSQRWEKAPKKSLPRRASHPHNGLSATIPMVMIPWDIAQPGHCEIDLVHHGGPDTSGDYVYTLQMVDVATGWSERRAVLGRSGLVIHDAFACLFSRFPFPLRELHSDNGGEFLHDHLLRFLARHQKGLRFSRSRPGHKNDNRFVEESNLSRVRAFVGHARLDTVAQTWLLNELYERLGWYNNLFLPRLRLEEKTLLRAQDGSLHLKRRYDEAKTPFDRLCATGVLPEAEQKRLAYLRQTLNPLQLRREIQQLQEQLFALPSAGPGEQEDVYWTLSQHRTLWKKGALAVQ